MTAAWDSAQLVERFFGDSVTTERTIWAFLRTVPPERWDDFWEQVTDRLGVPAAGTAEDAAPSQGRHGTHTVGADPFARDDLRALRARLLADEQQPRGRP
jgi:hypothetical protein